MPEWPPSPLRLFQALVASGVGREVFGERRAAAIEALRALERTPAPEIVAPRVSGDVAPVRMFVPDNVGDRVAKAWSAGREADLSGYRTEKDVRPLRLAGEAVHYVFRDVPGLAAHATTIQRVARSVTHLGWGIDMVVGDAQPNADPVDGERWMPGRDGGTRLRLPVEGTFDALARKHAQFLERLDRGSFRPVSPLAVYGTESYARVTDPVRRPFLAYRLLEPHAGDGLWFDPARRSRDVAAWTRHAVGEISKQWPFGSTAGVVHGHAQHQLDSRPGPRFSYLPLPTINARLDRVEGIRRVLVSGPPELRAHLTWLGTHLGGELLLWRGQPVAMLEPLPSDDWVLQRYLTRSALWATVTPVVLPGHDDGSPSKAHALLRKAFLHAGFPQEVVNSIEELEWRRSGFIAGTEHASRYHLPDKVNGPTFHVRVRFGTPVVGPIAVGSGRHRGLGLFASRP